MTKNVEKLILNALAQNPDQRYQNATHFCEAIEATIAQLRTKQQTANVSYPAILSAAHRAPKSITLKTSKPSFFPPTLPIMKSRRTLSTLLGFSSGLFGTAALSFMLLFGLPGKSNPPKADKVVNASQPAISAPAIPATEQQEEPFILIDTAENSSNVVPSAENDPWPNENGTNEAASQPGVSGQASNQTIESNGQDNQDRNRDKERNGRKSERHSKDRK